MLFPSRESEATPCEVPDELPNATKSASANQPDTTHEETGVRTAATDTPTRSVDKDKCVPTLAAPELRKVNIYPKKVETSQSSKHCG